MPVSRPSLSSIRRRLLAWFNRHCRVLPWRRDRDPYRIWVSEVMLQQTTVAAVIPKYEQFLIAFPTLANLARADEQDVLRHWQGLGYYRRARHLHAATRLLLAEHAGQLPDDATIWAALPGVGRYILGAVLSQAFDRRLPIIEANSLRVLCRLYGQTGDPNSPAVRRWLWEAAEELLPQKRVGDFNQALMELGALVCTPTAPQCGECPLRNLCHAYCQGQQGTIPLRTRPAAVTEVREVAVVVRNGGRVLLVRRPDHTRWPSLWEFPHGEVGLNETDAAAALARLRDLTGIVATLGDEVLVVRHTITRFRITLRAFAAKYRSGAFRSSFYVESRWVKPAELAGYPTSSPQQKLAQAITAGPRQRRLS